MAFDIGVTSLDYWFQIYIRQSKVVFWSINNWRLEEAVRDSQKREYLPLLRVFTFSAVSTE